MTEIMEKLYNLVNTTLYLNCPVLSRSMKRHIETKEISEHKIVIEIAAPFYDEWLWRKKGIIVYSGQSVKLGKGTHYFEANYGNITDYAYWVNAVGAFGTHNKSEHWVNRTLDDSCRVIANEFGATLINKLGR